MYIVYSNNCSIQGSINIINYNTFYGAQSLKKRLITDKVTYFGAKFMGNLSFVIPTAWDSRIYNLYFYMQKNSATAYDPTSKYRKIKQN